MTARPFQPLTSIVITTHRRLALFAEALRSAREQTIDRLEIIVVDDAGEAEVEAAVKLTEDNRVRYISRSQYLSAGGGQQCRNLGKRLATGDFVLFLDDDDLLSPTCVEERLAILLRDPRIDFCVGQCSQFDDKPAPGDALWADWTRGQDDLLMFLANKVPWQTSGPLWRREALEKLGDWDESLAAGWDYEYHIRALALGLKAAKIDTVDYHWRRPRPDSYSGFEAFKRQYRAGDHIVAFCKSIEAVARNGMWTPERKLAAWREAVRLAAYCRLNHGARKMAQEALSTARKLGCVGFVEHAEATACIAMWGRIGGKIPALAYLNRRRLIGA